MTTVTKRALSLAEALRRNDEAIRQVGTRALEEARRAGVPAYYMDRSLCDGIIREMPDGTREHIERRGGEVVVLQRFAPRAPEREG